MLPVIPIGSIVLPTYPIFLLIAFWVGSWLAAQRAPAFNIEADEMYNTSIYAVLAGLLGARFWYVLTHWDVYGDDLSQALALSPTALSFWEGWLFAIVAALIYLRRRQIPLTNFVDAVAPGLILMLLIAHIGMFLSGQSLGLPSDLPWAVDMAEQTRHPAHLYEAIALLMILTALLMARHLRPWAGFHFWSAVVGYGITRLFFEAFHEQPPTIAEGLLTVQLFSLCSIVIALAVMAYNFRVVDTKS